MTIETLPEGTVAYIHTPVFIIRCVLCVCVCVCSHVCVWKGTVAYRSLSRPLSQEKAANTTRAYTNIHTLTKC